MTPSPNDRYRYVRPLDEAFRDAAEQEARPFRSAAVTDEDRIDWFLGCVVGDSRDRIAAETDESIVLDTDGTLAGIVTKTDLLESLTWTDEERLPVQVYGADLLTDLSRPELAERIENVARKYAAMRVLDAKVHLQKHTEQLRGVPLLLARVRLYTDKGLFVASGEGYGDRHAVSLALNAIERQILEGKTHAQSERSTDEEDVARMYGWWLSE